MPESPKFSLGEHKTTEQTRVLSESDVYFSFGRPLALQVYTGVRRTPIGRPPKQAPPAGATESEAQLPAGEGGRATVPVGEMERDRQGRTEGDGPRCRVIQVSIIWQPSGRCEKSTARVAC